MQYGVSAANQAQQAMQSLSSLNNTIPAYDGPAPSALQSMQSALSDSHITLDHLNALADRIVGVRVEKAGNAPAPVPNGMLEENLLSARAVQERLIALYERLGPIA